ncbi:TonB-dependent receptor [Edaphobacter bradus]|uniref:TonB-dependent receptor n=1 Tax=Edaphobacter bradus TaxID=2259016 RepID=UPI0021E063A8|nr:TonB-dependent receptor [Edaphobacter bradus]
MRKFALFCLFFLLLQSCLAHATVFGKVKGIVHDPQHRPIRGAQVTLQAAHSSWGLTAVTNESGAFTLSAVPLGDYTVTVSEAGFSELRQSLTLASNTSPELHFALQPGGVEQSITVNAGVDAANVNSVTPTTLVSRLDIASTPGADRTNGLQMITDYVPGAYITHDMLHMRGGHQVSWQIDGVQIPNTNIASNLGAQIDPKDIDYLEVQRGSYTADIGDRTYGVFNVVPRTGFERNNEAELVLSLGNFFQTNDQFNFGSHTEKFAYYASLNGNRSDYGLSPPVGQVLHDAANGYGGFGSFLYNRTPQDQFRLVTQLRTDFYQIPYDPDPNSIGNQQYNSSGLRDTQREVDGLAAFSWIHSFNPSTVLQVSPFYHYNRANYQPWVADKPVATTSDRSSNYGGLQASITGQVAHNTLQAGLYSFGQHDSNLLGSVLNGGSASGGVVEGFLSDNYKVQPWLTVIGGLRVSHFAGDFTETYVNPRVGLAVQVPKLNWVFRGFYGRFYQPPPLLTASGPVIQLAQANNTTFKPLHGERDEEHQLGVQIPFRGWLLDADTFQTRANNFLDHSNIGESSLYYPVTVDGALIQGWELSLRSPRIARFGQARLAYSNQIAQQRGAITGGLVCYPIASPDCSSDFTYRPLDHDQRNTLNVGFDASLPSHIRASTNVNYSSGFHNGSPNQQYPGAYLPEHTTFDLAVSRQIGEKMTVSVNALNVANRRVLLDNSLTFGGFHYNDPREIYAEVRYRFHY